MSTPRRPRTAGDLQVPLDRALGAFRAQVREFLEREVPAKVVRDHVGAPFDAALWAAMAELDLMATLVPATHGGAGGSLTEAAVLMEELGRSLAPVPFLASAVMAAATIATGGDEAARAELLPRIADGSLRVAVAGISRGVIDAPSAELLIVVGGDGDLAAVDLGDPAVVVTTEASVDPLRAIGSVVIDGASTRRIGHLDAAGRAAVDASVLTMVAAEMAGGARRCLELSTDWAKLREQFGQPIGVFQAIKHPCVDMLIDVEAATAAVRLAARLGDAGSADAEAAAWLALGTCGRAYRNAAAATIQIHGGMGYVWEHEAHFHLKRAKGTTHLFGGSATAGERLASALGV